MHANTRFGSDAAARPMGDDWLTRDPESFGEPPELLEVEDSSPALPRGRWRRLKEDLLLYAAGITTGLMVVAVAWLLLNLVATPAGAVTPPAGDATALMRGPGGTD